MRRGKHEKKGFTLVELVTAAAIFSILGVMLFSMIRTGMTTWKNAESTRNDMDRGVRILETVARELRLAFTENDALEGEAAVRFLSDFIDYDRDGDGVKEARVQRLMFVRVNAEERENLTLRTSGDMPLGRYHFTLFEPDPELVKEEGTLPTGGLAEAVFLSFAPRIKKKEERDGFLSLYRGYRTPIGGEDSFFAPGRLLRPDEIEAELLPVLDGLLHLEFRFWDQRTLSFDENIARPENPDGAGYTWDSTRAFLSRDKDDAPNTFRFARGGGSQEDVTDDMFPMRVLIFVVVEEPQDKIKLPKLTGRMVPEDMRIPVDNPEPFKKAKEGDRFVRINEEWIEYFRIEGGELVAARRGARHTHPSPHPPGSLVHKGRSFSTVVEIPTAKACWNEEEDE